MVSLEQYEIAKYLYDYANLNYLMLDNPQKSLKSLFEGYMISNNRLEDCNLKYYNKMINTYILFAKIKIYCICEDYNIKNKNNFVNNEKLDLTQIRNSIIKAGGSPNISNKKILQLIKDALCHNTKYNQLYQVSKNGRIIEFTLQKPSPITIRLSFDDVVSLTNCISSATQTIQLIGLQGEKKAATLREFLNHVKVIRYQFLKKIGQEDLKELNQLSENEKHQEILSKAETIDNCIQKELQLTETEIDNIVKEVNDLMLSGTITKQEYKEYIWEIVTMFITKKFPLPFFKLEYYILDSFVAYYLQTIDKFSYEEIYKIISFVLPEKKERDTNFEKDYEQLFSDIKYHLLFKSYYSSFNEKLVYPHMLFIEYVIINFCSENEYIKIGKKSLLYSKIRNSLVHSRWCIDKEKIIFYDALTDIRNELNYNWQASINFIDLCAYCTEVLGKEQKIAKGEKTKRL